MKTKTSGFGPSLIELIVAVALFSIAAAICVRLFAGAKSISDEAAQLSRSVVAAQSAAECFKASDGDCAETARLCGGKTTADGFEVSYNRDFDPCEENGNFLLLAEIGEDDGVISCKITVYKAQTEIYGITAAVRKEAAK
ncbi:MAG: type II secretion system protein [Clostridia bacterium]|nr:type II secretion system protein [Clostridia bacterium]